MASIYRLNLRIMNLRGIDIDVVSIFYWLHIDYSTID